MLKTAEHEGEDTPHNHDELSGLALQLNAAPYGDTYQSIAEQAFQYEIDSRSSHLLFCCRCKKLTDGSRSSSAGLKNKGCDQASHKVSEITYHPDLHHIAPFHLFGKSRRGKDEVISAAKMANVHHFIKTLTGGYNFEINEESSNISQGEKQLLTIARAILKDPRIIILDEATSSVDTRLEKMLQDAMHKVMDGRTSFVIAHRLSTVRNADLILVVDHGDIVEQGTHEELLAKKGVYENLYHSGTSLANHQPVC